MALEPIDWDLEASKALLRSWTIVGAFTPEQFATYNGFFTNRRDNDMAGRSRSIQFMVDCGLPTDEHARTLMWTALRRALGLPRAPLRFDD